jgi:alpha-glucoside transport system substrate-binding protein
MRTRNTRQVAALAAAVLGAGLALASCASDDKGGDAGGTWPGANKSECKDLDQLADFGDLSGRSVGVYTSIVAPEDQPQKDSYKLFTTCTGAKVEYEGSKEFEAQLVVRVKSGNAPDIAYVPQPGLLATLVKDTGKVQEAPSSVASNVDKFFGKDWKKYGTVDGKFYAAPLGANVKSFVWYSPKMFAAKGWTVPTTWDEMIALSDKIAATGIKPWCAGIGSGDATGWPLTDWDEDMMLRLSGPETYDKWVAHEIPFNGPESTAALEAVGSYLKNPAYVNGGLGDVKSIATTTFQDGGLPILEGTCSLHRQASFYAANFPKDAKVAEDGDVFAFYLPGKDASSKPVLGGGEFVLAFADRPEVKAFQTYLSSDTWANTKAKLSSGWVSANKGLDPANLTNPIDQLSAKILLDPASQFRFDGSDQMPAAVGSDSFWKQATAWITGQDTKTTVDNIEKSWPK